ncbi:MAG: type II toxin-antitoxin system RelB/DinJ family antitoxin [Ruminococcus sp.]|nr:type II toxin-antitoxin system RelB/DinJ family antitoxin [Ruminococcus sp.]
MSKTANLYVRIEPELKEQAENILSSLGIPASNAINMFYKQIILQRGLPFDVKLPADTILNFNMLTEQQIDIELKKGLDDVKSGNVKSVKNSFDDIRKDYNL